MAKVNKGSRAIISNLERPHLLTFLKKKEEEDDDLANYNLINLTSKFGKLLKEKKNHEMVLGRPFTVKEVITLD